MYRIILCNHLRGFLLLEVFIMARTHTFKGSASAGYGYFAYIEEGQLVIGEDWGREGGILYRGSYRDAKSYLNILKKNAPKLYNSITKYFDERMADEVEEETITHHFKDSRDCYGYGYFGYIEDDQLVICQEAPREGGVLFRGTYEEAAERGWLATLLREDQRLYHDIDKYFTKHGAEPKVPIKEKTSSPAGALWKVKLYMANTEAPIIYVQVRGTSEASVINKLFPKISEVLTLQTHDARVIAVRSDMISAAEFMPED
jgi:hypothetical protein